MVNWWSPWGFIIAVLSHDLRMQGKVVWFHLIFGESLDYGLTPLHSESDIDGFKRKIFPDFCNHIHYMYIDEHPSKIQSYWPNAIWEVAGNNLTYFVINFLKFKPHATFKRTRKYFWKQFDFVIVPDHKLIYPLKIAADYLKEYCYH